MSRQVSDFKQVLSVFGFLALAGLADAAIGAITVPGAPTIGAATAGNASASIAFAVPNSNGGSTITGYKALCVTGSTTKTGTGTDSPIKVSGLTNGSAYNCSVKASNRAGSSAASNAVSVTPLTVPGAPTIGAATAGNGSASIAFAAPKSNGGSTITGYEALCVTGSTTITGTGTGSPIKVSGLTNGSAHSCKVKASNSAGSSAVSSAVLVTPRTVPGAPTIGAATAGDASASIAFAAPGSNGGSTITGYTASCVTGGTTKTGAGTSSPIKVSSLTNGSAYSCTVKASNSAGSSAVSSAVLVTPSSATLTYSTPANFAALVAKKYTPTTTMSAASTVSNRGYYMISDSATASTGSNYATIDATYSATAGYALKSATLPAVSTYNDYLTKTLQWVTAADGYYRLDSYLHPNNSIDVESATSTVLRFKNNFGKTSVTGNGYVTFSYDASTKLMQAQKRYIYATTSSTSNGSTVYTGTYTADSTFTGAGKYISFAKST